MRKLATAKRAGILAALVEGSSVNATARICGVSKITVLRMLADAGHFCSEYHDLAVRNLASKRVQLDEIWGFCGCKDKAKQAGAKGHGSVWTWTAIDADTKLCVGYLVGDRDGDYATAFIADVASRLANRVQLTSDGHKPYLEAVEGAFGGDVDYAMLVKHYGNDFGNTSEVRYSPATCVGCDKRAITGNPDADHISTSYIERQNLTLRMSNRRMTRLTNGFSKKLENHRHAVAVHYMHYNFIRKHMTLKTTPAVAAGIASRPLSMLDFVGMIEVEECKVGGRLTDYLPSPTGNSK
jgi:IS1 family transposase